MVEAELKKAVAKNWRYEKMLSLDMPIMSDDEKEEETLIDKIENRSEKAPDWAITYLTEMKATKEKVRNRFFDEAATIFEEAMEMNEKGITYYDVARKHSISEERARQLLKMVKEGLKD